MVPPWLAVSVPGSWEAAADSAAEQRCGRHRAVSSDWYSSLSLQQSVVVSSSVEICCGQGAGLPNEAMAGGDQSAQLLGIGRRD